MMHRVNKPSDIECHTASPDDFTPFSVTLLRARRSPVQLSQLWNDSLNVRRICKDVLCCVWRQWKIFVAFSGPPSLATEGILPATISVSSSRMVGWLACQTFESWKCVRPLADCEYLAAAARCVALSRFLLFPTSNPHSYRMT
jgi:hypothetical protein